MIWPLGEAGGTDDRLLRLLLVLPVVSFTSFSPFVQFHLAIQSTLLGPIHLHCYSLPSPCLLCWRTPLLRIFSAVRDPTSCHPAGLWNSTPAFEADTTLGPE